LYPLCSGKYAPLYSAIANTQARVQYFSIIPLADRCRDFLWHRLYDEVILNDTPVFPLEHKHVDDVSDLSKNLKSFHKRHLSKACNIVVFNEMFFSQQVPLTLEQKDFIRDKLVGLSQDSPTSFFYPNFLYTENRNVDGHSICGFLDTMDNNVASGLMDISHNNFCVNECRNELINIGGILDDATLHPQEFLINETYGINNGNIITTYKKASYFNEANDSVLGGTLYDFGTGRDIANMAVPLQLRTAVLNNISTEICFDLAQSVRMNNNWNNGAQSSLLHVLQSNSVDPFFAMAPNDNINRLPLNVPIAYADSYLNYSKCGVPFCYDMGAGRERGGELPYKLQGIRIGDSMYTMGVYYRGAI
jgi:hypothetical protein